MTAVLACVLFGTGCRWPWGEEAAVTDPPDYAAVIRELAASQAALQERLAGFHRELARLAAALERRDALLGEAIRSGGVSQEQLEEVLAAQRQQFQEFVDSYREWAQQAETAPPNTLPEPPPQPRPMPPVPAPTRRELPPRTRDGLAEAEAEAAKAAIGAAAAAGCAAYPAACPLIMLGAKLLGGLGGGTSHEGVLELLETLAAPEVASRLPEILDQCEDCIPFAYGMLKDSPLFRQLDPATRKRLEGSTTDWLQRGSESWQKLLDRYRRSIEDLLCADLQKELRGVPQEADRLAAWLQVELGGRLLQDRRTVAECVGSWTP